MRPDTVLTLSVGFEATAVLASPGTKASKPRETCVGWRMEQTFGAPSALRSAVQQMAAADGARLQRQDWPSCRNRTLGKFLSCTVVRMTA
jgi:hypothetical protein